MPEQRLEGAAGQMTTMLHRLLQDAFEIEGRDIDIRRVADRKLMLYSGRSRYELTVVKKQA